MCLYRIPAARPAIYRVISPSGSSHGHHAGQNPDGSFSWVEDFEESAIFEEGVYRANLLITAHAFPDGGAPQTVEVAHYGSEQEGEYASYIHYTQEFTITNGGDSGFLMGDANCDGVVNIRDVTAIRRQLADFPEAEPFNTAAADIDGGGLSITDATLIQSYLAEFASDYPIGSRVTILVD